MGSGKRRVGPRHMQEVESSADEGMDWDNESGHKGSGQGKGTTRGRWASRGKASPKGKGTKPGKQRCRGSVRGCRHIRGNGRERGNGRGCANGARDSEVSEWKTVDSMHDQIQNSFHFTAASGPLLSLPSDAKPYDYYVTSLGMIS